MEPSVDTVAGELERQKVWLRVHFYFTKRTTNSYLAQRYTGHVQQLESHGTVRNHLVNLTFGKHCEALPAGDTWTGIELRHGLTMTGHFTLGKSSYRVPVAQLWTHKVMDRVHHEPMKVVTSSIKTTEDYRIARVLGVDAVMNNSPRKMEAIHCRMLADQPGG